MAIDDLKIYGNDESTQSYSEFFNLLRQYNSDINATVEDLNKLNIDNVKNLGMLQKRQQEELANEYTLLRYKANEKDHADQVAKLNERYAELEKLDEEALKAARELKIKIKIKKPFAEGVDLDQWVKCHTKDEFYNILEYDKNKFIENKIEKLVQERGILNEQNR